MKRPLRIMSAVLGSAAICLSAATPGQACGFFHALFGRHHAPAYSTFYAPTFLPAGPCGAPAPACCPPVVFRPAVCCPSPCDPCGPCGPAGCPVGVCEIGLAPPGMQPVPESVGPPPGARPRTFVDEPQSSPMQTTPDDEGFRPRGSAEEYDRDPSRPFESNDASEQQRYRPESVIPQRETPPTKDAEPATDGSRETEIRLPRLNLDDKITWRTPPERTRLILRARYGTPVVARSRANPNEGWLPVPEDTRLARR